MKVSDLVEDDHFPTLVRDALAALDMREEAAYDLIDRQLPTWAVAADRALVLFERRLGSEGTWVLDLLVHPWRTVELLKLTGTASIGPETTDVLSSLHLRKPDIEIEATIRRQHEANDFAAACLKRLSEVARPAE